MKWAKIFWDFWLYAEISLRLTGDHVIIRQHMITQNNLCSIFFKTLQFQYSQFDTFMIGIVRFKWTDKWTDFNRSRFITGEMLKMTHNWWLIYIKYRIRPFTCLFSFRINSNVNSSDTRHHKSGYCHYICQHSVIICQQSWIYRGRLPECP